MSGARALLLTLAAIVVAALGWWLGGAVADPLGVGELDLLLRLILIFILLGFAEALTGRAFPEESEHA